MKRAWTWLRGRVVAVLSAVSGLLLMLLTAGWWVRRRNLRDAQLREERELAEATAAVARLSAIREETAKRVGAKDAVIASLDVQIRRQKIRVVGAAHVGEEMSDEELEAAFKRALGG